MKVNIQYSIKELLLTAVALLILSCGVSSAQDKSPAEEKGKPVIQLSFYKKADQNKVAMAKVTARNAKRKFIPVAGVKVNFYFQKDKEEALISNEVTGEDGKADIILPKETPADADQHFTIIAKIENDKRFEDTREEVNLRESTLKLKFDAADTGRNISAIVMETGKDGKEIPVKDVSVKLYVARLFGTMPALEDPISTTDENGEATFTLPKDIRGRDSLGNITLVAKVEENEQLGNVEAAAIVPWGVPLMAEKEPFPRAMWEPRAPIPLILTLSILFFAVWSTYSYLFYQVYKISKFKKANV